MPHAIQNPRHIICGLPHLPDPLQPLGWIWKKTRLANLITLALTGASWLFLGLLVGVPGYCPLTDWHFDILEKLGMTDLPTSYIKYLIDRLTGLDVNQSLVDKATLYSFIAALAISLFLNIRDFRKRRRKQKLKS